MKQRTPEHQRRVDAMRDKLRGMTEEERRRSVTVLDSILGFGDDEINQMPPTEIRAELEANGIDPDATVYNVMGGVLAGLYRILYGLQEQLAESQAEIGRLHDAVRAGVNMVVLAASPVGRERLAQQCAEEAGATWPHDTPGGIDDSAEN